jgi:hypothetical protein
MLEESQTASTGNETTSMQHNETETQTPAETAERTFKLSEIEFFGQMKKKTGPVQIALKSAPKEPQWIEFSQVPELTGARIEAIWTRNKLDQATHSSLVAQY